MIIVSNLDCFKKSYAKNLINPSLLVRFRNFAFANQSPMMTALKRQRDNPKSRKTFQISQKPALSIYPNPA
jgi:hypothetical protein